MGGNLVPTLIDSSRPNGAGLKTKPTQVLVLSYSTKKQETQFTSKNKNNDKPGNLASDGGGETRDLKFRSLTEFKYEPSHANVSYVGFFKLLNQISACLK